MSTRGVLQKDGTYCRKGSACRRHGSGNTSIITNWQEVKSSATRPTDLSDYYDETFSDLKKHLGSCGFKGEIKAPYWNDEAVTYELGEIECSPDTSLLVSSPTLHQPWASPPRNIFEVWLVKNGETVGMIKIYAQKIDEPVTDFTQETTISCIEVKPEHRGKKYSQELVSLVEKHLISTKIHSGGHYTPEGYKAMNGKLPYTRQALEEKNYGGLGIGVHFRTMTFIESWDSFFLK